MKNICDWNNCFEIGEYKAPIEKDNSKSYRLLCLAHVKEFNLIENHLNKLNLPKKINKFFSTKDLNKILSFMKKDKKNITNKLNLVLLKKIGSPIYKLQFDEKKINLFLRKELIK